MGYTAILGLRTDLHLVGQDYSWASSLFYFGYLTASGLVAILLVRLPVGRFMSIAMYVSLGSLSPNLHPIFHPPTWYNSSVVSKPMLI